MPNNFLMTMGHMMVQLPAWTLVLFFEQGLQRFYCLRLHLEEGLTVSQSVDFGQSRATSDKIIRCRTKSSDLGQNQPSSDKIVRPRTKSYDQSVRQASSQSVRQKHTLWVFCQRQTRVQAVGRIAGLRISSGRTVM